MDLKQLQAMGAVAPRALVKRDIPIRRPPLRAEEEWENPSIPEADESAPKEQWTEESLTVHIRKRSSVDFYELISSADREKPFVVILRCICDEKGEPVFSDIAQVIQLKEWLWMPLALAANEVNEFGSKNSKPRTSSGAKSHSPSADEASRNGKRPSPKKNVRSGSPTETSAAP